MGFRHNAVILTVVFLGGYLVMALEILAFRIVQIYFGSSIYSTGAVLGVVLAALSLGYWLGGILSLRFRATRIQATALMCAGIWIFLLAGIPKPLSEITKARKSPQIISESYFESPTKIIPGWVIDNPVSDSLEFQMRFDPLVVSLFLFAVPSLFLAMVGPCAISVLTRRAEEAGVVSGWVFALGSIGSISGVLVTSFWLIAVLGLGANLRLVGLIACILAAVAASINTKEMKALNNRAGRNN